jgi:hypothetical protein
VVKEEPSYILSEADGWSSTPSFYKSQPRLSSGEARNARAKDTETARKGEEPLLRTKQILRACGAQDDKPRSLSTNTNEERVRETRAQRMP